MMKKIFKVSGMHCASCAMNIEWELEDIGAKAKCSYATSQLEIEYDSEKIDETRIRFAVEKAGYKLVA